jgi:hypothetical protein
MKTEALSSLTCPNKRKRSPVGQNSTQELLVSPASNRVASDTRAATDKSLYLLESKRNEQRSKDAGSISEMSDFGERNAFHWPGKAEDDLRRGGGPEMRVLLKSA